VDKWDGQVVERLQAFIIKEEKGNRMARLRYRCG
jgi:hypothetical protein